MSTGAATDFAALLDDLIATARAEDAADEDGLARTPSLKVDLLDQLERLQAENKDLFASRAAGATYEENAQPRPAGADPEQAQPAPPEPAGSEAGTAQPRRVLLDEPPPHLQPALNDLFFLDPDTIARELGIAANSSQQDLDRARRDFAKLYHPDRVPEQFRERAALRMQIANVLIDKAKRAASTKPRRA